MRELLTGSDTHWNDRSRLQIGALAVGVAMLMLAALLVWAIGSSNPFTPAGYVGYMTKGAVMGKSRFYGVQRGPTSAGRTWLLEVTNVSVTPYTYTEDFSHDDAVLSRDNLKIEFQVHTVWHVDDSRVPLFMDRFSTTVGRETREKRSRLRSSRSRTATSCASRCGPTRATRCSAATASR